MPRPRKYTRRGRPFAKIDLAEVARLRDDLGLSWRAIGKRLNVDFNSARRAYTRTLPTAACITIRPSERLQAETAIPASGSDGVFTACMADDSGAVNQAA